MKKIINKLLFSSLLATTLFACKKDENRIYAEGGTAPVLKASTNAINLDFRKEGEVGFVLEWTNPNYQFTTGISSHDVNYQIEIDTAKANFNSPNKITVALSRDLAYRFTIKDLNALLGNTLKLTEDVPYTLEFRVKSFLSTGALPLYSNKVTATATPYAPPPKVETPTENTLWIVGDAVASGWNNPLPAPYDVSQKFTRVNRTLYELIVPFKGSGGYKLIQKQGVWGTQYKAMDGTAAFDGEFEKRDADPAFPSPPVAGTYKITVNFQTGRYNVVKQ